MPAKTHQDLVEACRSYAARISRGCEIEVCDMGTFLKAIVRELDGSISDRENPHWFKAACLARELRRQGFDASALRGVLTGRLRS